MKINFDLNISHLIIVGLCIALMISIISKPIGMTKEEAEKLHSYYYRRAMALTASENNRINSRLDSFQMLKRMNYKIMKRQDLNTKKLNDIDKQQKKIRHAIDNPKNYYIMPVDSIDEFWSKRLSSNR